MSKIAKIIDILKPASNYKKNEIQETASYEVVESTSATQEFKRVRDDIENDNSFENTLTTLEDVVKPILDGGAMSPEQVQIALKTLQDVAVETIKYCEDQETRREEIRAMRNIAIERIKAMRNCVQQYLDKSFDERSSIFAKQFDCVDKAIEAGDHEMLATCLSSINSLAASSPFKNLADLKQVHNALTSSATEWDI